jgi:hypothetical protein
MKTRVFKDAIYEQIARIGKSLVSGPRLELLDLSCQGPRTVEVLAGLTGQSVANTSRHPTRAQVRPRRERSPSAS